MLFSKRFRNSSRTVEVCEDRVRRQAERAPALPVRLEIEPGDQMALGDVDRDLERGRDRPVDREQADEGPEDQRAIDQHAARVRFAATPRDVSGRPAMRCQVVNRARALPIRSAQLM